MRFHMGVSFRPKQLIKWLIPILAILGFIGISEAKAETIKEETRVNLNTLTFCNNDVTEYVDWFEQSIGDNYEFIVLYRDGSIFFTFYPKFSFGGASFNSRYTAAEDQDFLWLGASSDYPSTYHLESVFSLYLDTNKCNNIDFRDNVQAVSDFTNYMENYQDFDRNTSSKFSNFNATNMTAYNYYNNPYDNTDIERTLTYPTNSSLTYYLIFEDEYNEQLLYSSKKVDYSNNIDWIKNTNNNLVPYDNIRINNKVYRSGEEIKYDYQYFPVLTYDTYSSINHIYVYTSVTNINRVNFDITYQTKDNTWEDTTINLVGVYGQKNIGDRTYTMEKINNSQCTWSYTLDNTNIDFTGMSCSGDFTGYSSVSFHFITEDYSGEKLPLWNIRLVNNASSYSNVYINEGNNFSSYEWYFPLILTSFDNQSVDLTWSYFLSSSNTYNSYMGVRTNQDKLLQVPYTIDPLQQQSPNLNYLIKDQYTDYNNAYYYKLYTIGQISNKAYLLMPENSATTIQNYNIQFFGNTGDYINLSNNGTYCYMKGTTKTCETIDTSNFVKNGYSEGDYSYGDIEAYNNIVANYINGLSTDMINFGNMVQDVYDTIPSFLSNTIVVLFILGNSYIVYNLIKRR